MFFFLAYPVAGLLSIVTLTVNVAEEARYPGIRNLVKIDSDRDRALTCNLPPPSIRVIHPRFPRSQVNEVYQETSRTNTLAINET